MTPEYIEYVRNSEWWKEGKFCIDFDWKNAVKGQWFYDELQEIYDIIKSDGQVYTKEDLLYYRINCIPIPNTDQCLDMLEELGITEVGFGKINGKEIYYFQHNLLSGMPKYADTRNHAAFLALEQASKET